MASSTDRKSKEIKFEITFVVGHLQDESSLRERLMHLIEKDRVMLNLAWRYKIEEVT